MWSKSKYHAQKIMVDGIRFDSKKEAARYTELRLLEQAGEIKDLQMQVPFQLLPSQKEGGKVVERAVMYKADFTYYEPIPFSDKWVYVVEDTKGVKTKDYILKRKMMLYFHGIRIREV